MRVLGNAASTIESQAITSDGDLFALHAEWADLWLRCPSATPFQSPDWLIPFWRCLGEGELLVFAFRDSGRLVGLAPFFSYAQPGTGERRLMLLGTGVTDYLDILADPDFAPLAFAAVLSCLEDSHALWDVCDLQQLLAGSCLLTEDSPPGWGGQISVQEVCPVLTLPETTLELPRYVPARMLDKLRYYRRRLQRAGMVEIVSARLDNFLTLFERFLQLHGARWSARGLSGVLKSAQLQQFHRETAERMLLSGSLRLYGLCVGETVIATLYSFAHNRHSYFYLSGFDPEFSAYSPGTVLIGHAIEHAVAEGSRQYDFLRGREAYKYMWGAKGRLNYRRLLWAPAEKARRAPAPEKTWIAQFQTTPVSP